MKFHQFIIIENGFNTGLRRPQSRDVTTDVTRPQLQPDRSCKQTKMQSCT